MRPPPRRPSPGCARAARPDSKRSSQSMRRRFGNCSMRSIHPTPRSKKPTLRAADCAKPSTRWPDSVMASAHTSTGSLISRKPRRRRGRLDEEFSCANSRFFRTALYANAELSQYLRDNYVLHWESVRPVPRITIDFGDGRKLERTITGNSIHYVLDSDGRPIDALPGLYGPKAFRQVLERTAAAAKEYAAKPAAERAAFLSQY